MRKWKFIGDHYELSLYRWKINPVIGEIYTEDQLRKMWDEKKCVPFNWNMCRVDEDWQEVVDEEKVQLTETEKIVLIGFLNDHFEEFCDFIDDPTKTFYENFYDLDEGLSGGVEPKVIISNLIDKIEKL